jgi:uncharacterized protein
MIDMLTSRLLLSVLATALVGAPTSAQAKIKVLFLGGGTTNHDPAAMKDAMKPVLEKNGMLVDYKTNENVLQVDSLGRYDVMIIYNAKKGSKTDGGPDLTAAQEDALYAWVRAGHTVIGVHCANSSYLANPRYLQLFGAEYTVHGDDQAYKYITIVNPGHPAMQGVSPPPATGDNAYWDEGRESRFTKIDTVILARAKANGKTEPWTWVRPEGKGWVYYTSSGHDIRCWSDLNFQNQLVQALTWGADVNPSVLILPFRAKGDMAEKNRNSFMASGFIRIMDVTGSEVASGTDIGKDGEFTRRFIIKGKFHAK